MIIATSDKHLAIGQQRRRVVVAWTGHGTGQGPDSAGRIVEFRAGDNAVVAVVTAGDEDLAVRQQRSQVTISRSVKIAGAGKPSICRIVKLRAVENTVLSPDPRRSAPCR